MQNICLKFLWFATPIFDLSQPGTSKKEKIRVFWGLKKEKLHLCGSYNTNIFLRKRKYIPETFNAKNGFGNFLS